MDDNGTFYRIQCKTGRLEQDGTIIRFATSLWIV
jgi:hypothetical protein